MAFEFDRLKTSLDDPERSRNINVWKDHIDSFYYGTASQDNPEFNLLYVFGAALVPNLVFQNPYIMALPRSPQFAEEASLWEGIDNFIAEMTGLTDAIEKMVLFGYTTNLGILELGWDFDGEPIEGETGVFPRTSNVDPSKRKNFPIIRAGDPKDFIFPTGITNLEALPWYGKEITIPLDAAKEKFNNPNLKATGMDRPGAAGEAKEETVDYFTFYLVRNAEDRRVYAFSIEGETLMDEDDPLQKNGLPIELLNLNPTLRDIYGTSDISLIESQYMEGNETRKDGRWQRKAAVVKGFYDSSLVDQEDMARFVAGDPLAMIGIDVPAGKTIRDVVAFNQTSVQREFFEYQNQLIRDCEYMLGYGPNQLGVVSSGRRTAYEMQQVSQNNTLRVSKRRDAVAKLVGRVFEKINGLVEEYWGEDQVIPVIGKDLSVQFVQLISEDLSNSTNKISTKVSVESLAPYSSEQRKADLKELMVIISKFSPEQGGAGMIQPMLKKFLSLYDYSEIRSILPQNKEVQSFNEFQQGQQNMPPQALQQGLQNTMPNLNMINGGMPDVGNDSQNYPAPDGQSQG